MNENQTILESILNVKGGSNKKYMFLRYTSLNSAPNVEPWVSLKVMESDKDLVLRVMALILNGCLTNNQTEFLLSQRILNKEIKENYKRKNLKILSGKQYKTVMKSITENDELGFMKCKKTSSRWSEYGPRLAGTFQLTLKSALLHIRLQDVLQDRLQDVLQKK